MRLLKENTFLLVIDVQEKIFATMYEQRDTEKNINRLIEGAKVFNLPIVWTEQYPKGLGPTIASVRKALEGYKALEKISFSCLGNTNIQSKIASIGRKQVLVCGIEAHVCVYQTVINLLQDGYDVHVVNDAVMSRKESNYYLAIDKMSKLGASITSVEMALFELQKEAKGESFKAIAEIIK